ncbi:sensor histidine kinase [Membranihabitans marinus]|uniref:sensor histidine kinase n=1 Tax=Membranihabitans marinus TaxID=1227546 RepID=UPI001F1D192F|nr:ATP-binding protein [Membranihabitans marinus]
MNLKWQYGLFVGFLIASITGLLYWVFQEALFYFFIGEFVLLLLIVIAINIYNSIFRPLKSLTLGRDALNDHDFNNKLVYTNSKEINGFIEIYNEIIDRIRQERTFQQEQHYFLQQLMEALPIGILILDFEDKISEFNPMASQLLDLNQSSIGLHLSSLPSDYVEGLITLPFNQPHQLRTSDGRYMRCISNRFMHRGFPRKFILIEEVSNEIIRTEKQIYSKIIRMMAHEVNNTVGAVNSIMESLLAGHSREDVSTYLPMVLNRNERLNIFMSNFANLVKIPEPTLREINLNDICNDMFLLMRLKINRPDIDFKLHLSSQPVLVWADRSQLEQVLINVILNAAEAIEGDGQIDMVVKNQPSGIEIIDTGMGITDEVKQELFKPFFSNKTHGQGIGLTMVREILSNHQVRYSLSSERGVTTFQMYF